MLIGVNHILAILIVFVAVAFALREFRSWSTREKCEISRFPNYPFAYSKYKGQVFESKGRVNTNQQDFRHECQSRGGRSKCHICEEIECLSDTGLCQLQLQGVNNTDMSQNIPIVSDTAWAVGGAHRRDYGGSGVTHFCVFLTGGNCILPSNTDFSSCVTRCFGKGFSGPSRSRLALDRSVVDVYPGMGKWEDDGQVDLWVYPRNCSELSSFYKVNCTYVKKYPYTPSYNPQGFTFTLAGKGTAGFVDGAAASAKFFGPEDVAVDKFGNVFVADTLNNAIRMIANGTVVTIAGKGPTKQGFKDGLCSDATFTQPKGLDVRVDTVNGKNRYIIVVADTGNHRIRRIEYIPSVSCVVKCLTGLCGNNTLSQYDLKSKASPISGYADGSGTEARFSAPESVAFMKDNYIAVADTGNFLIRWVADNGSTWTLAGTVVHGPTDADGKPLAGCTPPCLVGQQGFEDGNLVTSKFYNPLDVTPGPNNTLWVVDEHRLRVIHLPFVDSSIYTIRAKGQVFTIAGTGLQGHDDAVGTNATFYNPSGAFVTSDNIVHVVDSASCRIRRVTPIPIVAEKITCSTKAVELIRPSGCTSYDQAIDKVGKKVSRVEANIQYNYGWPYENDKDRGKYIKNCVGTPPRDTLDKHFVLKTGDNLVVDDNRVAINEDSEQGTAIIVECPAGCQTSSASVYGSNDWYSETSSVCRAAIHAGILGNQGGYLQFTLERFDYLNDTASGSKSLKGSTSHSITSLAMPSKTHRVFSMELFHVFMNMVHTIGGHPMAPLESGCGFAEGQPPTMAYFNRPAGISAQPGVSLSDKNFLYVADSENHRIRGMSAVCTQICENGGSCVAHDTCKCPTGWTGRDCTTPVCTTACPTNQVCVGPNQCECKPGYSGKPGCTTPLCLQKCRNGGRCSAPDTCSCPSGWFDMNCTTPVCSLTCANGGNCTAPNQCACPQQWKGVDCRTPVCEQTCHNNGLCVAPNTCVCPPQWSGHDCSIPVCSQGYFQPNPNGRVPHLYASHVIAWPTYKYCDMQSWCNYTNEFECDQLQMKYGIIEVPSGPEWRNITGRKERPTQCMMIELPITYKLPFEILRDDGTTTGKMRYSPITPYQTNDANPWKGYLYPVENHTGPWEYSADRQVAYVNWLNVSQGVYVCANGGNCTAPDICECAPGWSGFDCRTPVCDQGYYYPNQTNYVSGEETAFELTRFMPFMGNNSYNLSWPYSNPNYTIEWESYKGVGVVVRIPKVSKGRRYLGQSNWFDGQRHEGYQGGYRCSIRAVTQWENMSAIFSHPNYYSRYMDKQTQEDHKIYSFWEGMHWPQIHHKSRILDRVAFNITFAYTNEGWRRYGIWNTTANDWVHGVCIVEFNRNCSDPDKDFDLQSQLNDVYVQDTDIAYRPRITYNDYRVTSHGRWKEKGGACVDQVIRGCFNNGTCVAPNTCKCAAGWRGWNCNEPICAQTCHHHGNCTGPNQCTCERGWTGYDCSIPICAQECQNGGFCIAPDTCKCKQWPNVFRDGRLAGGRPLFQDSLGYPLPTGWTGYDCSVPICVQAEKFLVNVGTKSDTRYEYMGGHGGDGKMQCLDKKGNLLPRCPDYDAYVTSNIGTTFQTGCGFDPYDTGCCIFQGVVGITCYKCSGSYQFTNNTFICDGVYQAIPGSQSEKEKFKAFLDENENFKLCGRYHSPRNFDLTKAKLDYGTATYYTDRDPLYSSYNFLSNLTSNRFLCNIRYWTQGDYIDDGGLGSATAVGSIFGLDSGRHYRINYPNIIKNVGKATFDQGPKIRGEGVYACSNSGSCLAPDICSCTDGYEGYDCTTPLCRHLQPSGAVTACLNGGVCVSKDNCECIQTGSVAWKVHKGASRGVTGWTGSDCSIPMCSQGYFDPFCTDLPQAPAGEGCYRCANGGNCTAPDVCTCAPGWTGFDCRTPVCEVVADPLTRTQLGTVFEDKVIAFESDPCGVESIHGLHGWKGRKFNRGNCTMPNQCTCLCKVPYSVKACKKTGALCDGPWQDPMANIRNVLINRGVEFTFGSTDCAFGYEGNVDSMDRFTTCHQTIYLPSDGERNSIPLIVAFTFIGVLSGVAYYYISQRIRKRMLLAKIERRRSKRSSEESLLKANAGAFVNK